jgi:hypothetical protein
MLQVSGRQRVQAQSLEALARAASMLDLNHELINSVEPVRRILGDRVALSTSLCPGLGLIRGDASQLRAAILTLAASARDAMPEGGRLVIETRNVMLDQNDASRRSRLATREFVRLSISPLRTGALPDLPGTLTHQATEFDVRTVWQLVTELGGHVTFDSAVRGTTMHLHFARVDNPSTEAPDTQARD